MSSERMNPTLQDNYLCACSMLAQEMRDLFEALRVAQSRS
jgi:hypothetical protein